MIRILLVILLSSFLNLTQALAQRIILQSNNTLSEAESTLLEHFISTTSEQLDNILRINTLANPLQIIIYSTYSDFSKATKVKSNIGALWDGQIIHIAPWHLKKGVVALKAYLQHELAHRAVSIASNSRINEQYAELAVYILTGGSSFIKFNKNDKIIAQSYLNTCGKGGLYITLNLIAQSMSSEEAFLFCQNYLMD
jgi:hypothetical protein